jgi:cyclic beta-1,2-glucan synthetase
LATPAAAAHYEQAASAPRKAANEAWDGNWYLRAITTTGLRSEVKKSDCCRDRFDILKALRPSAMKRPGEPGRTALDSALLRLFDREKSIVRLFEPSFEIVTKTGLYPSYGPGFRENGGQYTHGAVWLAMAALRKAGSRTATTSSGR